MRYFKKVVGKQVYLSPINADDTEKYTEWLSDIEITKNLSLAGRIFTVESERQALLTIGTDNFAIVASEKDLLIGNCGYLGISNSQRHAEVGIFIGDKDYLGKGYGTEAMQLLLDFGFNIRNYHSLRLRVRSFNKRAIACYEKCGFKPAGRFREAGMLNGEYFDDILMDILEDEFRVLQAVNK